MANVNTEAQEKSTMNEQEIVLITEQERERMVAEAAYFNAMHRGFQHADPDYDWFLAEKQIEQLLHPSNRS